MTSQTAGSGPKVGKPGPLPVDSSATGKPGELNPIKVCRDLGLTMPGGMSDLSWGRVLDLAVNAYWDRRIVHGPRCGTSRGFGDHGNGPKCQPCIAAEKQAIHFRRAGEAA